MGNENFKADVRTFRLPTAAAGCYRRSLSVALLASVPQDLLFATDQK